MTSTDPDRREAVTLLRGSAMNLVGGVVALLANLVIVALLSRALGATGIGAFLIAVAVLTLTGRLSLLGANTSLVRFVSRANAVNRSHEIGDYLLAGTLPAVALAVIGAGASYVAADDIARIVSDASGTAAVASYVRAAAWFVVPMAVLAIATAVTRGLGTMVPTNLTENLLRPVGQVLLVGLALQLGASSEQLAIAYWTPWLVASAVAAFLAWRLLPGLPIPTQPSRPRRQLIGDYWRFSAFRATGAGFAAAIEWLDVLMLGGLATTAAAGVYGVARRYLGVGRTVQFATTQALNPQMSRLLAIGDHAGAALTYQTATAYSVILTWPLYVVAMAFAPTLLSLLGPSFGDGATAARVLALAWMLSVVLGPVDSVLLMAGRSWWSTCNLGIALAANVGLNIVLIPRFGATGAAVAWFASIALKNVLALVQVRSSLDLTPWGRLTRTAMAASVLAVGLPCLGSLLLLGQSVAGALTGSLVGGVLYLVVVLRSPDLDVPGMLRAALRGRRRAHPDA